MKELENAIEAAGLELEREHGFELLRRESESVMSTRFGQIVMKHVYRLVAPFFSVPARKARIAELRAELELLVPGDRQSGSETVVTHNGDRVSATVEIRPFSEFSANMLPCLIGDGEDWIWAIDHSVLDDGEETYMDASGYYFSSDIVRYFARMPALPTTSPDVAT